MQIVAQIVAHETPTHVKLVGLWWAEACFVVFLLRSVKMLTGNRNEIELVGITRCRLQHTYQWHYAWCKQICEDSYHNRRGGDSFVCSVRQPGRRIASTGIRNQVRAIVFTWGGHASVGGKLMRRAATVFNYCVTRRTRYRIHTKHRPTTLTFFQWSLQPLRIKLCIFDTLIDNPSWFMTWSVYTVCQRCASF